MIAAIDFQVALISVVCLVAGLGLGWLTWWFWRSAQPESPALAALELMSERRWEQADEAERARILESGRIDPATVAPLTRREAARPVSDDRRAVEDEMLDEWTDLGPIDPLLR
jgi:hypothetical protein